MAVRFAFLSDSASDLRKGGGRAEPSEPSSVDDVEVSPLADSAGGSGEE